MQKTITPIDNSIYVEREYHSDKIEETINNSLNACLLYTSPSPRDGLLSRMPSSA